MCSLAGRYRNCGDYQFQNEIPGCQEADAPVAEMIAKTNVEECVALVVATDD